MLALRKLVPLLRAMPTWPGGWQMAAEAYALVGQTDKAASCTQRICTQAPRPQAAQEEAKG